ncbi:MAG: Fic/DOC family N-terminal domain-containing protein [Bacteroidota bacterium]
MSEIKYQKLAPLPPDVSKIETVRVLRQVAMSSLAIAELKGVAETIPDQQMLVNAIILKEAKDSSEIENIITSTDELYVALNSSISKISSETKEVVSYRRSIMMGYAILSKQEFIRVNDIVAIQRDLIQNNAGLRTTPGTVLKNDTTGEVVYTPPQNLDEINDLLSNFIRFYNDKELRNGVSPLIWLGILHYQFESIHPFYDGNGRTGRILNILYLIMNDLLEIPILYLSSYIIHHKNEYYRLLNQLNKGGDWESWILFMLKAVEETSKSTLAQIKKINNLLLETLAEVKRLAPKIYSKELVELLFEQPYSKIEYVVKRLDVERKAASRYLNKLTTVGILEKKRVGKEYLFINIKLLAVLKQ